MANTLVTLWYVTCYLKKVYMQVSDSTTCLHKEESMQWCLNSSMFCFFPRFGITCSLTDWTVWNTSIKRQAFRSLVSNHCLKICIILWSFSFQYYFLKKIKIWNQFASEKLSVWSKYELEIKTHSLAQSHSILGG